MVQDKLQLNDAKTEFLIIGTRAQLNNVTINDLQEVRLRFLLSILLEILVLGLMQP